ncbi:MAG: HAMP domain-containing protein [Oceanospirillaceae bacterium]|nr:HAMP domain-containing protein [Oceanospirillaceae bacterium]
MALKRLFNRISVKVKLMLIVMIAVTIAIFIAAALYTLKDRQDFIAEQQNELIVLSDVIGQRSSAALMFQDNKAAEANLASLSPKKSIIEACMYLQDGKLFAEFHPVSGSCPDLPATPDDKTSIKNSQVQIIISAIRFNQRPIGWIYIAASTEEISKRLRNILLASMVIGFIALLVAMLISWRIQRFIVRPINNLKLITHAIAKSEDYSLRAPHETEDEIGDLVTTFNRMLNTIQQTNLRLSDAVAELKSAKEATEHKAISAEEKAKAVHEFFAGMSHDLKQPLSAMNLFMDVLKSEKNEDKRTQYIDKVHALALNLSQMFSDIMDQAKIENRINKVKLDKVALKPLLQKIVQEFDVIARDKKIGLRIHVPDCDVLSNASMLERIVRNLLANAIRYTDKGGVLLAARRRDGFIDIQVWDTGIGIPADKLTAIFETFTQLNNPDGKVEKGFGLGLSIVKKLAGGLGHCIEVKSRFGRGTLFSISVPEVEPPLPMLSIVDDWQHSTGGDSLIYIIDDERAIAEALLAVTIAWEIEAEVFCSIAELNTYLAGNPREPDFILTDYTLSATETGLDALELIETHFDAPKPAVVISGETDPKIIQAIADSGCYFLPKPPDLNRLWQLIEDIRAGRSFSA